MSKFEIGAQARTTVDDIACTAGISRATFFRYFRSKEEAALHEEMAARATDHAAVLDLDGRLRALSAEREALEEQWLEASETAG